jgi:hypothetical protein
VRLVPYAKDDGCQREAVRVAVRARMLLPPLSAGSVTRRA